MTRADPDCFVKLQEISITFEKSIYISNGASILKLLTSLTLERKSNGYNKKGSFLTKFDLITGKSLILLPKKES